MSTDPVSHDWVRARFRAWAAGLLDDDQRQSVEAHLVGCDACRSAVRDLHPAPDSTVHGEHIPSTMLAGWNRLAPRVTGELRALLAHHLDRCADCRRELETLGLDAGLIRGRSDGAQEAAPAPVATAPPRGERGRVVPLTRQRPMAPRRFRWVQRLAIAAILALVATPVIVTQVGRRSTTSETPGTVRDDSPQVLPQSTHSPPAPPTLALGSPRPAIPLDGEVRGGAPIRTHGPIVSFDPIRSEIALAPPRPLALAEADEVRLLVLDGAGAIRLSLDARMVDLFPSGGPAVILIRQGHPPLDPGPFTLRVRMLNRTRGEPEEWDHPFQIR